MCPPVTGGRGEMLLGESVPSSFENRSENELSEQLPDAIKDQLFDLPSFITPEQRSYVGNQILNICDNMPSYMKKRMIDADIENDIELQKLFVKLAKNYFDGSTTLEGTVENFYYIDLDAYNFFFQVILIFVLSFLTLKSHNFSRKYESRTI